MYKAIFKNDIKQTGKMVTALTVAMFAIMLMFSLVFGKTKDGGATQTSIFAFLQNVAYDGGVGMVICLVYIVVLAISLLTTTIDNGAIVVYMSAPLKKRDYIVVQGLYFVGCIFLLDLAMFLAVTIGLCARVDEVFIDQVAVVSVGTFAFHLGCGGLAFLFACLFNKPAKSYVLCGAVFFLFMVMTLLVKLVAPDVPWLENIKYINLFSLYDLNSLRTLSVDVTWQLPIYVVICVGCMFAGGIVFCKKDMPI